MKDYVFGIDVGGTTIKCGLFQADGTLLEKWEIPTRTENNGDQILPDVAKTVLKKIKEKGIAKEDVAGVGIDLPGPVNEKGEIAVAVNLNWGYKDIVAELGGALGGIPVKAANDANAAALGEMWGGGGRGTKNLIMVTLGTGVGGGIIIDGKIYSGYNHAAAEVGHMVIERNGVPCSCGRRGCMEAYASVTGLIRMTKEAMLKDEESEMWKEVNGDINAVNGRTSFDAMRKGDASAQAVVNEYIEYLGNGVSSFVNILQPEYLVIGGGISKEGETLLAPLRKIVKRESFNVGGEAMRTKIVAAQLGNDAGIIGAAFLGKNAQ